MLLFEDILPGSRLRGLDSGGIAEVVQVARFGPDALNLVFRVNGRVGERLVYRGEEASLELVAAGRIYAFDADGGLLRLASEAYRIRLAHLFDPYLAVSASQIEALPHQITAVYGEMLPRQPLRFLLADDPGAGKTIMAGLLIKELLIRGDLERCLIVAPGTLLSGTDDANEEKIRSRFEGMHFERIPYYRSYDIQAYSERSFFGALVDILHPYSVLRVLAKANEDAPVVWQYGPLVQAGWATEREFVPHARRIETFLIATEGSSDVHILKHALALLRPGIADFFRFIDVSEVHPFSGTGNLVKFAEGLAKIDVQNQVVFVFDNDAEGLDAHQRLSTLILPANMRGIMLPELEDFRAFPAQGPEGLRNSDINRRAAAIECYLDLDAGGHPPAKVLWTNYKKSLGTYQGALEYKESYSKEFLKQTAETLAGGAYDVRKIEAVLDLLIGECTAIAVDQWNPDDVEVRDAF